MTALPFLTLIPAGAGSGKTYRIKEQLADWVENGLIQPQRIAAVTFTESAAGELRERIRTTLMARGRLEEALGLDQAFISTIHGFGRRLLTEYAFEAGKSPAPRLLAEDEEQLLLRKAIARIERIEPLSRDLRLFGYRFQHPDRTDVAQFRQRILTIIHLLRTIGGDVNRPRRLYHCLDYIRRIYGPTDDAQTLTAALRHCVQTLLDQCPNCMVDFVNSDSAKSAVEEDYRHLRKALGQQALDCDWALWKRLQALKVFKRDNQLPADYQARAREVIERAGDLARHPGPLNHALQHAEILLASAWDALTDYARSKKEKGIIDFTDMIDGARLLLDQPDVLAHLARRFDCLVIDEFQDTNPLQFAFLWKLHRAGVPALIVGDTKQSIMGFQAADPRLMDSLLAQCPEHCKPLTANWRSQAKLMAVINAFGGQLFGEAYTPLAPQAAYASQLNPLEAICFDGPGHTAMSKARHVAARIREILADGAVCIFDRHLNRHRPIRGEDIAILGLTHTGLGHYAEALRELGIRVRLAQDGWFESRSVQLAYHGLSFATDPQDRHAALYLAVTELGQDDLTSAVQTLLRGEALAFPLLERLKAVGSSQPDLAVDELVQATLAAMGLFDAVAAWPQAGQHRANLLRLIVEARTFVSADREALAASGFHGSGLNTFLAWIVRQLEGNEGNRQPEAQVHDEAAVQLHTWHSAKGKEWPVVVVASLDREVGGRLPSLDIQYTDFTDLDRIIENARLEFSPQFEACETNENFSTALDRKACTEGRNLLYVALSRAREQLILEWPAHLETSSRYTYWHLLTDGSQVRLKGNQLRIGGKAFSCRVTAADREPPAIAGRTAPAAEALPLTGRRALKYGALPEDLSPIFVTPSQMQHAMADRPQPPVTTITYGAPLILTLAPGADRGTLIHRALELLGQGVPQAQARTLLDGPVEDKDWQSLQAAAARFRQCLDANFQATALHWEVPFTSVNHAGSVISGAIDLLVETPQGYWIIDHKTTAPEDLPSRFESYRPQLEGYAEALSQGLGLQIRGVAIHWVCLGGISQAVMPMRQQIS